MLVSASCTTVPTPHPPADAAPAAAPFSHALFDEVLAEFVNDEGLVDYTGLLSNRARLDAYYAQLAAVGPDDRPDLFPTEADRLAYWINAYNAAVIETVLLHYPIASVRDVRSAALFFLPRLAGFFYLQRVELGGRRINLYDLENRVIRKRFDEPRIHFALNCASLGCPQLPRRAFHAATLSEQLEAETRGFVAEARNVDIDPDGGRISLSSIFDWYAEDFEGWMERHHPDRPATLTGYVALYLEADAAARLEACASCRVEFVEYDWGLNDASPPRDD